MTTQSDTAMMLNPTLTALTPEATPGTPTEPATVDPIKTATGVYVSIHGHFYQPPRENPYLDAIERQPSASPFHDWNERIYHECYRPNAYARVFNDSGEVMGIVNNYEYLSFNIGATLMTWLERYDREVYNRILEADRQSAQRLNGHGNAIAQVYNHIIMPLANQRDKYTQIRWGKEDFRSRFGRDPEGMWLAETAVDYATLEALIAEGIQFIILAPSQAQRCRVLPTDEETEPDWIEVGGAQIDPTRPYRCFFPDPQGGSDRKFIDIFFYDGPISRDMGFDDLLNNSHNLLGRLGLAIQGDGRPSQLLSVATDGETFGHHKGGTEKCLAYAFVSEFPKHGWTVTNFAHYLSISPPSWEVQLKSVTAWSCAHGVDRWQDDCGCGGGGSWHQKWRRPLRESLNWLRDQLTDIYEEQGRHLFLDPWQARDEYIKIVRDRSSENIDRFFRHHQTRPLTPLEQVDGLRLLEMQRHSLLMYTSCGWFFEELSRPEGVQILRYAARAIELAGDVAGVQLEREFIARLALASSNVDAFKDGAGVYRDLVQTDQISLEQVAAHYAISGLFTSYGPQQRVYCYDAYQRDYQLQRMGPLTLGVGQLQLVSEITRESVDLVFAVLHLGGWDFHCSIQPFTGRRAYTQMKEHLFGVLQEASAAHAILAMNEHFDGKSYNLRDLFAEERHRIMRLLSQETLMRLDQLYSQVYRDNYGVMMGFHRDELPVPKELQVAAEIALGHRCMESVLGLEQELGMAEADGQMISGYLGELESIATEAEHTRCNLYLPEAKVILERSIWRSLWDLLHQVQPELLEADIHRLERLIAVGQRLNLGLSLERSQELYFYWLTGQLDLHGLPAIDTDMASRSGQVFALSPGDPVQLRRLLLLGQTLRVHVTSQLEQLR